MYVCRHLWRIYQLLKIFRNVFTIFLEWPRTDVNFYRQKFLEMWKLLNRKYIMTQLLYVVYLCLTLSVVSMLPTDQHGA